MIFSSQFLALALSVTPESTSIDPAKSVFVKVALETKSGEKEELPDLRSRIVGFSLAEDFEDQPISRPDGSTVKTATWRLVPEPAAAVYKIRPVAVGDVLSKAIYFDAPEPMPAASGAMDVDPKNDFPSLGWRLVRNVLVIVFAVVLAVFILILLVRFAVAKIRKHRMSPIERAWVELDRLLAKNLPASGKYKDFYVELTLVVRRYVQRKYGVKAPHMTTQEFLSEVKPSAELEEFLVSADMVKFAGIEATPTMAKAAVDSARNYLKTDEERKV